jgi:hypothetical protein
MLGFSLSFPVLFPRLFPRLAVHTILIAAWSVRRHHRQAGAVAIRQHASKAIKLSGVLLRFFVPGSGLSLKFVGTTGTTGTKNEERSQPIVLIEEISPGPFAVT